MGQMVTSRKKQAEKTKSKIMKVASKLVEEKGFDQVKVSDICKKAGISVGAFYHHFPTKTALIVEGYKACDDYFKDVVGPQVMERDDFQVIEDYIGYQMEYATNQGVDLMTRVYEAQLTEATEFFLSTDRVLAAQLVELINNLQKKEVLISENQDGSGENRAEQIAAEILTIARGNILNWCQSGGSYDLVERGKKITNHYLMYYKN